ncbi:MAG: DUF1653 domain-containing protein [Lachnospiraceae bacterium]|nr:DUF1653 domain-containing protein [Lachnospiraceae bacterium]
MPQGNPRAGEFYLHFKKKLYQVLTIATHSETRERLVIYQALYGDYGVYARPYSMFISEVDHEKYPEVKAKYRFTLVEPGQLGERKESHESDNEAEPANLIESIPAADRNSADSGPKDPALTRETEAENVSHVGKEAHANGTLTEDHEETPLKTAPTESPDEEEAEEEALEEAGVNPLLLEFLDEDNFGRKYKILEAMQEEGDINDTLIDNMAASIDVVIPDGPVDDRFDHLKYAVSKRMQFETDRFRR